jgi:proteasome lid subunit RPN8/RPN11
MADWELLIERTVLDEVIAHARAEAPEECCGILLGAGGRVELACPCRNVAEPSERERRFLLDPRDHFAARRLARQRGLAVVGFYHSHPRGPARPSASDRTEAAYPEAATLIVSLDGESAQARLFEVREGEAIELPLNVLEAGA